MRIAIFHPFDPRDDKVGGIETFIRDYIETAPANVEFLVVGLASVRAGAAQPDGDVRTVSFRGRTVGFVPVASVPAADLNSKGGRLLKSLSARYALGLLHHSLRLRRLLRAGGWSLDFQRLEFAPASLVLGRPFTAILHGQGAPRAHMDSALKRLSSAYALLEGFSARRAHRLFSVAPNKVEELRQRYPDRAPHIQLVDTWADEAVFQPTPFPAMGPLRIVFCGRLDAFKDPDLLFAVVGELARRGERVEFHYAGPSDPAAFAGYEAVKPIVVRHGVCGREQVREILRASHLMLLTSHFEGMPMAVLEALKSGRPVVSVDLPQLGRVVKRGCSGELAASRSPGDLADAVQRTAAAIRAGEMVPETVAAQAADFSPRRQVPRMIEAHAEIAAASGRPAAPGGRRPAGAREA